MMIAIPWRGWILAALLGSALGLRAAQADDPFYMSAAANPDPGAAYVGGDAAAVPETMSAMVAGPVGWTFAADLLIMQRSPRGGPTLLSISDSGGGQSQPLLDTKDLNFHTGTGPRLSLVRRGALGWGLELGYFQLDNYRSSANFNNLPADTHLYISADGQPAVANARFEAASLLRNAEVNLRRDVNDWLTPLVGFRWTTLSDGYLVRGELADFFTPYEHAINTENRLYGLQMGAQAVLWRRDNWRLESVLKAGIYGNDARQNATFNNPAPLGNFAASDSRVHPAFVGELGFTIAYQLTERLSLRGGYQFLWIEGVALPPQQIEYTQFGSTPSAAALNASAGLYYQGGTVGLDFCW